MTLPSSTQYQLVRYLDGGPRPTDRTADVTYAICARNGWIEPAGGNPGYRVTGAGREAMAAYEATEETTAAAPAWAEVRFAVEFLGRSGKWLAYAGASFTTPQEAEALKEQIAPATPDVRVVRVEVKAYVVG